ncbi:MULTISPECIES: hypothetical protein [Arthrobacter]|uniref:hypothetical protein n=1 Tax=Arthrobacter TaxID=1663 RepID=UPI0014737C75|nr:MULTISPECIES: hypothetical protein [Arthrobacter]NYG18153.1 hypothetical protein [Arthrobacter psychrochitiniphilus]
MDLFLFDNVLELFEIRNALESHAAAGGNSTLTGLINLFRSRGRHSTFSTVKKLPRCVK